MDLTWLEIMGLVGVTLVISTGKVFNRLREYLKDFEHPLNPLQWAGDIISCSMCSGFWVGTVWGLLRADPFLAALMLGGFISVASFAADVLLGLVDGTTHRITKTMMSYGSPGGTRSNVAALAGSRARARPRVIHPGEEISEDEADALADAENKQADALVSPPDEVA